MNQDNQRLKEIQQFLTVYYKELERCDTITECLVLQDHIDELEKEQKQILERCDVKI